MGILDLLARMEQSPNLVPAPKLSLTPETDLRLKLPAVADLESQITNSLRIISRLRYVPGRKGTQKCFAPVSPTIRMSCSL